MSDLHAIETPPDMTQSKCKEPESDYSARPNSNDLTLISTTYCGCQEVLLLTLMNNEADIPVTLIYRNLHTKNHKSC